uniref:WRKY transcription factor 38 n=1 Tax=Santalum album TaxID=35974 RepID=A0A650C2X9_SANAL|nr:WRKY transcription factor 38 [Santalum album]
MSSFASSQSMAESEVVSSSSSSSFRPTLTLPPRSSMESLFTGGPGPGASPGPMTLVSNFFSDTDPDSEFRSFSELLAGAMTSPAAAAAAKPPLPPATSAEEETRADFRFKQNRPTGLMVTQPPVFTVPPGLSPAGLLDSPGFFSGTQSPFGVSHQQALAQVTAQAAQAHYMQFQAESMPVPSFTSSSTTQQQMPTSTSDSASMMKESLENSQPEQKSQTTSFSVDKPADDGFNWRKYGQKQVKGSEFPRSYYKCTYLNCPVKKKVEHSADGQVTEIIYKGHHNHPPPQPNKRSKDSANLNGNSNFQANPEVVSKVHAVNFNKLKEEVLPKVDQEFSEATPENLSGSSGSEEVADNETRVEERDEDEPDSKRRNTENRVSEPASSHRTVTEPRIIVQTTSEVDLLDDGYRWRKYGQKIVKGNPYPRSYYKCTNPGCNVRKHIERAATDPKAVITTYEGKHNHDVPMAKNSSRNTASSNPAQLKPDGIARRTGVGGNDKQPVTLVRLKEEQTS